MLLTNVEKLRRVVTRLFTGTVHEVLAELFQNSQRAGASRVDITSTPEGFTYTDNGEGINGLEGFRKLLTIAESDWDEDTVANQNPMGMGIQSLLCLPGIKTVTFHSGDLAITIDTDRWWKDTAYAENWEKLFEVTDFVNGFKIKATGQVNITDAFEIPPFSREKLTPAHGYQNLLQIWHNGKVVNTAIPNYYLPDPILEREYQGAKLTIGTRRGSYLFNEGRQTINWYGQIITSTTTTAIGFYLEVTQGQPVTPMAPARRGIIQDEKWKNLQAFIKTELIQFFTHNPEAQKISTHKWKAFLSTLSLEERQGIGYTVAQEWDTEDHDVFNTTWDTKLDSVIVPTKGLLSLAESIVLTNEGWGNDVGISTFVPLIKEKLKTTPYYCPYTPKQYVWWQPGETINQNYGTTFTTGGVWGISHNDNTPPTEWYPVGNTKVLAVEDTNSFNCTEPNITVANISPDEFYTEWAWAGFDPQPENGSYDAAEEEYRASMEQEIISLNKAVPLNFKLSDLAAFTPNGETVQNIEIGPQNITVTFSNNEKQTIKRM